MGVKKGKIRAAEKLYKQRRFREAERAARELVNVPNDSLAAVNLLAFATQKQGKRRESEIWFARSLRSAPRQLNATLGQAQNKEALGKTREAQDLYLRATQLSPNSYLPYLNLGRLNRRIENFPEALRHLREALRLKPDCAEAYAEAGAVYSELKQNLRAKEFLLRAVELDPTLVDAHANLARLLLLSQDWSAAISRFKAALALKPNHVPLHLELGRVYRDRYEREKAIACYRHALTLNPKSPGALSELSSVKRFAAGDPDMERMQELIADPAVKRSTPKETWAALHRALAKAYDDCSRYDEARDLYLQAKRLAREVFPFSLEPEKRFFARVKEVFDAETVAKGRARGVRGHSPIFIVGLPRSGKTSIAEVIGLHPRAFAASEAVDISWVVRQLISDDEGPFDADKTKRALFDPDPSQVDELTTNAAPDGDAARITVNSNPGNYWALGAIEMMFPEARIIHCRREPLSHCLSIFKSDFRSPRLGYSNSIEDTVELFGMYEDLMAHWRSVLASEIHETSYSDMVANGEAALHGLFDACGLDIGELDGPVPALSYGSHMDNGIVSYERGATAGSPGQLDQAAAQRENRKMLEAHAQMLPALRQWL